MPERGNGIEEEVNPRELSKSWFVWVITRKSIGDSACSVTCFYQQWKTNQLPGALHLTRFSTSILVLPASKRTDLGFQGLTFMIAKCSTPPSQ